jgi:hypothetical protein
MSYNMRIRASSRWNLMFLIRQGPKVLITDALGREMKWSKSANGRCMYLDPFGKTDLPHLMKDLTLLLGPWVKFYLAHESLEVRLDVSESVSVVSAVVFSTVHVHCKPCGGDHWKPTVWPLIPFEPYKPLPEYRPDNELPELVEIQPEPLKYVVPTPELPAPTPMGSEVYKTPNQPALPVRVYTAFMPDSGKKLIPPMGASVALTMEQYVQRERDAGNHVEVRRTPEHDRTNHTVMPDQSVHEYAYQVTVYPPSTADYDWGVPEQKHLSESE